MSDLTYCGLPIIVSANCLKETEERLFPESKNRSKRIFKKLIKRFGGEFKKVPAIFRIPYGYTMHPEMYHRLRSELPEKSNRIGIIR